jgi:hypothetical protein
LSGKRISLEEVKNKVKTVYGEDFTVVNLSIDKNNKTRVNVICNNCKSLISWRTGDIGHGDGCRNCTKITLKMAIEKVYNVFGDRFIVEGIEMKPIGKDKKVTTFVNVICTICNNKSSWMYGQIKEEKGSGCVECNRVNMSKRSKQMWEDGKIRDNLLKVLHSDEYREKQLISIKKLWDNEDFKKQKSMKLSNMNKMNWTNEEFIKKQSDKMKGKNNPNYNPNRTDEEREKERKTLENDMWVKEVYQRDNYTCKYCGKRGGNINAHHLDSYHWCIEKRFDIDNGITLCEHCHKKFHEKYGYKNNTKEQFDEYIKAL